MTFDPNKPVQTCDGREARIICTDMKSRQPIIAIVTDKNGSESVEEFSDDGSYHINLFCSTDLINIPEKKYIYAVLFHGGQALWFDTEEETLRFKDLSDYFNTYKIEE